MKKFKIILTTVAISFMLSGCYLDDYRNIEKVQIDSIDPTFGFPLINSIITINDLLSAADSTTLIEVRNDSVFLVFKQEMDFDLNLNDFKVPDKGFSETLNLPSTGRAFDEYAQSYTTIESESEIKLINIKSGKLTVTFERATLDDSLKVMLVMRSLTTPAKPDSIYFESNWAANKYINTVTFDLAEAKLLLEAKDEITGKPLYNVFSWGVNIKSDGQVSNSITTSVDFSSIEFTKITGLINYEVPLPTQTIDLGAFTSIVDGEIRLSKPTVALNIGTSFGAPSSAELSQFTFKNSKGEVRELQNKIATTNNTFLIGAGNRNYMPSATSANPYVQESFLLNSDNSNIEDILPFVPTEVSIGGHFLLSDYQGTVANPHNFFVLDTSSFNMALDIEVPLAGSIKDLNFHQDIDNFAWPEINNIEGLSDFDFDVEMILKTSNQIPLTFGLQLVFIDNGVAIDSLFSNVMVENIVQSPRVDKQGLPLARTEKMSVVKMNRKKYDKISKASQIRLKLTLESGTEAQRNVLFKASQNLDVKMSVKFQLMLSPDI